MQWMLVWVPVVLVETDGGFTAPSSFESFLVLYERSAAVGSKRTGELVAKLEVIQKDVNTTALTRLCWCRNEVANLGGPAGTKSGRRGLVSRAQLTQRTVTSDGSRDRTASAQTHPALPRDSPISPHPSGTTMPITSE